MTKCGKVTIASVILAFSVTSAHAGGAGEFIAGVAIGAIGKTILDQATRGNNNQRRNTHNTSPQTRAQRAERARRREETKQIQTRLTVLGFNPGGIDGGMGPKTRRAIGQFQASIGHPETGVLTQEQTAILFARSNGTDTAGPVQTNYPSPPPAAYQPEPDRAALPGNMPSDTMGLPMEDPTSGNTASLGADGYQRSSSTISGQDAPTASFNGTPPDVLGVGLGTDAPSARTKLEAAGLTSCTETGQQLVCRTENNTLKDTVTLAYTRLEAETRIHTILREIAFNQPVDRRHVLGKLDESYPDLVAAPDHRVFASRDCETLAGPSGGVVMDGIMSWSKQAAPVTASIGSLASSCGYFYSFDLANTPQVRSVSISLFEGGPITEAMRRENGSENPLDQQIRF
ncbi:peptidoglycan-binding domain-containing protein [uncultured Roseibium sp.]|uniref:peptidoglycan-binding domain-containing protein n=1 Tax=uncultured Roseibium sp. TaxID=1936171 RepID=UPI003217AC81